MPLAWGIFLPFCARAARRRAGLCGKENLYTNSIIITIGIFFPRGRQCTGPCPMPEGLWAAAAGRLGAAPAAGSGKGGRKCQRRVVPLAVNSAGHWGSTGGRGTALAEGNSAGSGRRHGPRTAQAIGAASMGKTAPAAGNKARGAGLAHLRNFWYTGSRTHAAGGHRAKLRPVPAHRAGPGAALGAGGAAAGLLAAMHWRHGGAHTAKGGKAQ